LVIVGLMVVMRELIAKTGTTTSDTEIKTVSQNNGVDPNTLSVDWYSGSNDHTSDISR